ncbi:Dihydrofolate reductase [Alloactinosynnema sp. L-07]|uniref:dihydrofolate reductase family protein n=1 Tax=Alloactinosynnema sp. L-07 TaxID=1653480 RepID=UPI00065EFFF9|nr:dihydrofolate reductase family protein [Alloactinosynnema sp. L-07]CRK59013.1 Dihydrofolate reductase [Alloactinosynnema sp. L-07]
MRKVTASLFISLDGVVESPDEWQFSFDDEMGAAMMRALDEADTVLLGRTTYTEWAEYWPTADDEPFASLINGTPRYVASTTLDSVDAWPNSTLIKGTLAECVTELRQGEGGTITVAGSPSVVRALLDEGLLDELTLLIHPVIAGGGRRRLFADTAATTGLELVDCTTTSGGVLIATYRPAR